MGRDHSIHCEVCDTWHGGLDGALCDCEERAPLSGLRMVPMWPQNFVSCIRAAALEEMRVQAAAKRVAEKYKHELSAARRMVRR